MRRFMIPYLIAPFIFEIALAQDPANFHIIYGNRDGSPMDVRLGSIIEVPCWVATDPTPGNGDTVNFMHNPLLSDNQIIIADNGGFPIDDCDTFAVFYNHPIQGFTSHIHFYGPRHMQDPPLFCPGSWTGGDTVFIGTFRMTTANDTSFLGQTICPFSMGHSPANGGLLWGIIGGIRSVVPTQTYGCLHFMPSQSVPEDGIGPDNFSLSQNYPNPFNPETNIGFSMPKDCEVSLIIYSLLGQRVKTLIDGRVGAGQHVARWDGRDENGANTPSGIYFYKLRALEFSYLNKMSLIR